MSNNGESPTLKIVLAALAAAGAIGAAVFTFLSSKYSVDRPILATQTAEMLRVTQTVAAVWLEQTVQAGRVAPTVEALRPSATPGVARAAPTLQILSPTDTAEPLAAPEATAAATADATAGATEAVAEPYFTVVNRLGRPVTILVDDRRLGETPALDERSFLLESFPATVEFRVRRPVADGVSLGQEVSGHWTDPAEPGDRLIMDNKVGESVYFFLLLTNETDQDCRVVVNEGLKDEQAPETLLAAGQRDAEFGYYRLHPYSTVRLRCGEDAWYWGQEDAEDDGRPLGEQIAEDSGELALILEP